MGLSELVKDRDAIFLSELERDITILDPAATKLVLDTLPRFRDALLYIESLTRQTPQLWADLSVDELSKAAMAMRNASPNEGTEPTR